MFKLANNESKNMNCFLNLYIYIINHHPNANICKNFNW